MNNNEKFEKELKEVIEQLPGILLLKEDGITEFSLVGGAVYDSVDYIGKKEKHTPKDYDIFTSANLHERGYDYLYETEHSTTYQKKGMRFQILKTDVKDFDFSVSTAYYKTYTSKLTNYAFLLGDMYALKNKILVPVESNSFANRINQLARLPRYISKGFSIHPKTYQAFVRETHRCGSASKEIMKGISS